jgi:hypothetical protein
VRIPVRVGPSGDLLIWFAARWHREVEPLHDGWSWGWAYRDIRGGGALSNHASGTAIDLNAPAHGLGTPARASFSVAQIAAIHRILADAQGCLRWGGDYGDPAHGGVRGSRTDPMHTEVIKSEAECARVLAIVTKTPTGGVTELSAEFEAAARARWPKEDQLDKDTRGDLHNKQVQLDRVEAAVKALTAKVDALAAKLEA